MEKIQYIYSIIIDLYKTISSTSFQTELNSLNRSRVAQAGANVPQNNFIFTVDKIISIISEIETSTFPQEVIELLNKLDIKKLLGLEGKTYLEEIKRLFTQNPANATVYASKIKTDYSNLNIKLHQLKDIFEALGVDLEINKINDEEAIIEIIFDNNVAIDDFKEAKDQMQDWFLIIEGYARLLNSTREEFEIIEITKNSPTKFKIKTSIRNTTAIVAIVSSILVVQKQYLENQLMIEQLKKNTLVPNSDLQKKFIEESEKHLEEKIEEKINKIVDDKFNEYNKNGDGDVKVNLKKAVNNQYTFIANGGDINIYSLNGEINNNIKILEKTKEEIKQIQDSYLNQKAIAPGFRDEEIEEAE